MIPYGRQSLDEADIAAVTAVLRSDFLTQGPLVARFEAALAARTGAAEAVAVNSATSALHVAYRALGLGPGDLVWTTPNTFVATANAARLCGADVDFVDIDPMTYNLDAEALARKLAAARAAGGRLPAIVATVDFAGQPCAVDRIRALAEEFGFRVVEDASHALGATWRGEPVGCGRHAAVTVFSFHPVKIITTAEGGAATTNDPALAVRMRLLRTHGVTREADLLEGESHGPWYYEQIDLGPNYRLTDLQAALGLSQLGRLDAFLARRRAIAARYDAALEDLPLVRPWQDPDGASALHLYPVRFREGALRGGRRAAFEALRARGIGVQVHYIPVHTQPYYRRLGFGPGQFPRAEAYYAGAVSLPIFAELTEAQQGAVIAALRAVCAELRA
ncbi:UDP-4-amino-4, 6-dideoxy-N-acetyl-beta-L-altrosamine transaminase [Methylobacterium crusticola]|uniref:UDP-4-amino-4, 6-dideoxy-N-acetyl-beta-L-altrosamine transaminase n=1 Tax=Methylobacterium crusticola TaxID=1697972 RepID=A0ABQ4QS56_9HYPH|nr:UDP-4-amino-4,6-dideoxy-N-acetyl-beta-L-altrosamine transaminase [Methylobacterium crusticola]GJD47526.1 UDP-4-amino-4, 6-dideoxy-N-acetyl-beta-L-altrosamine transaminase [Methylobacterium crusticola]